MDSRITDWGREAMRLQALPKKTILEHMRSLGVENTDFLRHQTTDRLIAMISRMTSCLYDADGMLR